MYSIEKCFQHKCESEKHLGRISQCWEVTRANLLHVQGPILSQCLGTSEGTSEGGERVLVWVCSLWLGVPLLVIGSLCCDDSVILVLYRKWHLSVVLKLPESHQSQIWKQFQGHTKPQGERTVALGRWVGGGEWGGGVKRRAGLSPLLFSALIPKIPSWGVERFCTTEMWYYFSHWLSGDAFISLSIT